MSQQANGNSQQNQNISTSGYFGLEVLYAIPIIGTIFLIKHATDNSNINRRNFARSKFIPFIIWGVIIVGLAIFGITIYAINGWAIE